MTCRALLVDFDGVIRHWNASDAPIESAHALPVGSLRATAFAPDLLQAAITGRISDAAWRACIVERLRRQHAPQRAQAAVDAWSAQPGAVDHAVVALLHARVAAMRLVLVTNATTRLHDDLRGLGLTQLFDAVINSSELGVAKPDAAMFQAALDAVGVTAGEALFVDDSAANVAAAARLGIAAHVFTGPAALQRFLEQHGALKAGG